MHRAIKHFLAYLLLLLLPLQSLAAVAVLACYTETKQAAVVEHEMEGCHDASMTQESMAHADKPTIEQHAGSSESSHTSSPCGMSSGCLALASIAVLPNIQIMLLDPAIQVVAASDEFYLSYIPEGLQRPPQFRRM